MAVSLGTLWHLPWFPPWLNGYSIVCCLVSNCYFPSILLMLNFYLYSIMIWRDTLHDLSLQDFIATCLVPPACGLSWRMIHVPTGLGGWIYLCVCLLITALPTYAWKADCWFFCFCFWLTNPIMTLEVNSTTVVLQNYLNFSANWSLDHYKTSASDLFPF